MELEPGLAWPVFSKSKAYYELGIYYLKTKKWGKSRSNLMEAKSILSVSRTFQKDYGDVDEFERKFNITLPPDIKELLEPTQ